MKRGEPPRRRKTLDSRSELPRRTPLPRTSSREARPKPPRRPGDDAGTAIPDALKELVIVRATDAFGVVRCDRCARPLAGSPFSRQHRKARGSGGRRGAHSAANLVLLCGSATSPHCHHEVESVERTLAYETGFAIRRESVFEPEEVPILRHWREWVIPTADGWESAEPLTVFEVWPPLYRREQAA